MRKTILSLSLILAASVGFTHAQDVLKKHGFKKKPLTFCDGQYNEFFNNPEVVQIGSVMINTRTNKVVKLLDDNTPKTTYKAEFSSMCIDPHAEKYYSISPYVYANNNPIKFIDADGRDPGDFFISKNAAAKDWGMFYNGSSILKGKEYGSTIYSIKKNGKFGYTYTKAAIGDESTVNESAPPSGKRAKALIHSHGKYDKQMAEGNDVFSNKDEWHYYYNKVDGYVATPDGSLIKYDVNTTETTVISTQLPSDSNDPNRKNKVQPKENTTTETTNTTDTEKKKNK